MRHELQPVLEQAQSLPCDQLPRLLGELREIEAIAMARMNAPATSADETLDAREAAKRLGISRTHFYHHYKRYSFAWKEHGKIVASAAGLRRYQEAKRRR